MLLKIWSTKYTNLKHFRVCMKVDLKTENWKTKGHDAVAQTLTLDEKKKKKTRQNLAFWKAQLKTHKEHASIMDKELSVRE